MNPEQYYDEVISPKLMALAKECEEHGLSFLAVCEYGKGKASSVRLLQPGASFSMHMADVAVKAHGNVDSMMMALEKHARHWGHNSVYLALHDIPARVDANDTIRLRTIEAAAKNLVSQRGRYNTEVAYAQLAEVLKAPITEGIRPVDHGSAGNPRSPALQQRSDT